MMNIELTFLKNSFYHIYFLLIITGTCWLLLRLSPLVKVIDETRAQVLDVNSIRRLFVMVHQHNQ